MFITCMTFIRDSRVSITTSINILDFEIWPGELKTSGLHGTESELLTQFKTHMLRKSIIVAKSSSLDFRIQNGLV